GMFPSSCDTLVALPPSTVGQRVIFGKNSDRPCDEVQEVLYYPAKDYSAGEKVECTYVEIEQVPHTYAIVLSRPNIWEIFANMFDLLQDRGTKIIQNMRELEKEKMGEMEQYLTSGVGDSTLVVHVFSDTCQQELEVYSKC
uniref:Uncharacterized protein n=1 Tax=Paramormyrops kingsleyae TaxID=1676925 RepID=A0A3B3QKN3_9TELE